MHNRICLPGLSDLYNSSGHIHPVYFLPLSEFHIALDAEVRSIQPVKFHSRAVYLRQSPQFIFRILQSQMRVGIHRYADVRMAHQVLQRLRIHPRSCHVRAVGVAAYMRRNRRHLYSVNLIVTVDRIPKIVLPVQGDQRFSIFLVVKKTGVSLYHRLGLRLPAAFQISHFSYVRLPYTPSLEFCGFAHERGRLPSRGSQGFRPSPPSIHILLTLERIFAIIFLNERSLHVQH